jgi:hypothetical protein
MVMLFGDEATMREQRSVEWVREMMAFMDGVNKGLVDSGEWVAGAGLADPTQAKVVDVRDGALAVTDGPFAESKESLAGWWIIDVEGEARAVEFASRIATFIERPVEVRQLMDATPPL